jgi:hypothetical protein
MPILQPSQNQIIAPGTDILLHGTAFDSDPDFGKPPGVGSVTYQIDGGPAQPLAHSSHTSGFSTFVNYSQFIGTLANGNHVITVTTNFTLNTKPFDTIEDSVTVDIIAANFANLTGTCTAKSAFTLSSPATIVLTFSPPSVVIQSFPQITFPTSSFAGASLAVTVSLLSPGPGGNYDASTGIITIPGVVFNINATITVSTPIGDFTQSASGTFTTTLTTERTTSSEVPPVFTDNGQRLQAGGQVLLVGDGKYSSPIFGMTDGGIALAGIIAPHP